MFEMQNGKDTGGLNVINCHENNATDCILCQFEYYEDINYIKGGKFYVHTSMASLLNPLLKS